MTKKNKKKALGAGSRTKKGVTPGGRVYVARKDARGVTWISVTDPGPPRRVHSKVSVAAGDRPTRKYTGSIMRGTDSPLAKSFTKPVKKRGG